MTSIIISAKNITKTYKNGHVENQALRGVTLDINKGDFLMITGRNGSGKSTFMHQVALLDYPSSGSIMMSGRDITKLSQSARTSLRLSQIGYVFQEYALIGELSALQNVMLPAMMLGKTKDAKKSAIKLLKRVGLEKMMRRTPSQLSGGEQQRVAIARALVNNPKILFADEPTANLDSFASKTIMDLFKSLNEEGITIVMVTHEPDELVYATNHIIFADGKVAK
jgi:putative ABC transport system ATP-binding protein